MDSDITITRVSGERTEVIAVVGEIDIATCALLRAVRRDDMRIVGGHDAGGLKYHIEQAEQEDAAGTDDQ